MTSLWLYQENNIAKKHHWKQLHNFTSLQKNSLVNSSQQQKS